MTHACYLNSIIASARFYLRFSNHWNLLIITLKKNKGIYHVSIFFIFMLTAILILSINNKIIGKIWKIFYFIKYSLSCIYICKNIIIMLVWNTTNRLLYFSYYVCVISSSTWVAPIFMKDKVTNVWMYIITMWHEIFQSGICIPCVGGWCLNYIHVCNVLIFLMTSIRNWTQNVGNCFIHVDCKTLQ